MYSRKVANAMVMGGQRERVYSLETSRVVATKTGVVELLLLCGIHLLGRLGQVRNMSSGQVGALIFLLLVVQSVLVILRHSRCRLRSQPRLRCHCDSRLRFHSRFQLRSRSRFRLRSRLRSRFRLRSRPRSRFRLCSRLRSRSSL
jgi:hypothetical protein